MYVAIRGAEVEPPRCDVFEVVGFPGKPEISAMEGATRAKGHSEQRHVAGQPKGTWKEGIELRSCKLRSYLGHEPSPVHCRGLILFLLTLRTVSFGVIGPQHLCSEIYLKSFLKQLLILDVAWSLLYSLRMG